MKKDQANKTDVERVYRWWPLAWEPGPHGSGIDLQLVREWAQHSCISCTSMLWSWSRVKAEGVEWRWPEVGGEGEGRSYHDSQVDTHMMQFCWVEPWWSVTGASSFS